jgi:hypothetical protein
LHQDDDSNEREGGSGEVTAESVRAPLRMMLHNGGSARADGIHVPARVEVS